MPEPARLLTDIAILWQRGFLRCVLTGNGTACALVLMNGERTVRTAQMPDEATVIASARALRDHEDRRPQRSVASSVKKIVT